MKEELLKIEEISKEKTPRGKMLPKTGTVKIGNVYNFKELCEATGISPVPSGASNRSKLFDEWGRLFNYHRQEGRQTYMITAIHEKPLPYFDRTDEAHFKELVKDVLLDFLLFFNYTYGGIVYNTSLNNMMMHLSFVNEDHKQYSYSRELLQDFFNAPPEIVEQYFNIVADFSRRNLEHALNWLAKNKLLVWSRPYYILETIEEIDSLTGGMTRKRTATEATEEETSLIQAIYTLAGSATEEDGYLKFIGAAGKASEYYKKMVENVTPVRYRRLMNNFMGYKIILNADIINVAERKNLNSEETEEKKKIINEMFVTFFEKNMTKRIEEYRKTVGTEDMSTVGRIAYQYGLKNYKTAQSSMKDLTIVCEKEKRLVLTNEQNLMKAKYRMKRKSIEGESKNAENKQG